MPFRLDFDRYEDQFPGTRNQRFYGFEKLTFSSNFSDNSQRREVLATEILRDFGVPAARAAFYRVFVDTGSGWGLYTMIEDPADGAMLDAQFGGRDGNLYKPDGPGADWTTFTAEGFGKRTNEDEADFTDVESAVAALHAAGEDADVWRTALEERFDVDGFLRWLAVNTAIQNWDAYGAMPHNYYLYGDPAQNARLRWIPWDHNMAFGFAGGFGGGCPGGPGGRGPGAAFPPPGGTDRGPAFAFGPGRGGPIPFGPGAGTDVLHEQVGDNWPLIQRLLADDVYAERYRSLLGEVLDGPLAPPAFEARIRELHALITSAVQEEHPSHTTVSSPEAFAGAIDGEPGLLAWMRERHETVRAALERAGR